jgi:CheY-like chemotaxis protein
MSRFPGIKVLIAEPEPDIRAVYSKFLKEVSPVIVDDGEKCLTELLDNRTGYDLVIIDTYLKDADGIQVVERIRSTIPDQMIIVTSTLFDNYKKEQLRSIGVRTLDKPFVFTQLLAMIKPRSKPLIIERMALCDHVLGIYDNHEQRILDGIRLLKATLANNESFAFVVSKDTDIQDLRAKIMHELNADVGELISAGSLFLISSDEWYLPDGVVDRDRIVRQWNELGRRSKNLGKSGFRAFCMMDCFFEHGFANEVVEYEHIPLSMFETPFIPMCTYRKQDIDILSEKPACQACFMP